MERWRQHRLILHLQAGANFGLGAQSERVDTLVAFVFEPRREGAGPDVLPVVVLGAGVAEPLGATIGGQAPGDRGDRAVEVRDREHSP